MFGSTISPRTNMPPPASSPFKQCENALGVIPCEANCETTDRLRCPNPKIPSMALSVFVNCPLTDVLHLIQVDRPITRSISNLKDQGHDQLPGILSPGYILIKQVPDGRWFTRRQWGRKSLCHPNTNCPRRNVPTRCFHLRI